MRGSVLLSSVVMLVVLCLCGGQTNDKCTVTIKLTELDTGNPIPGLIRATDADGKPFQIPGLLSRGHGLSDRLARGQGGNNPKTSIASWSVLPNTVTVELPRTKFVFEAFSGLETETGRQEIDLTGKPSATVSIPLTRFYDARKNGLRSANTHLHLMKISREECDRYLLEIPKADRLDVLFLSYLERAIDDREYISNKYNAGDLAGLTRKSGVVFGNGEEHRHNFGGGGQGYGHVMLLNIKKLILPVSIGPGIMKGEGSDGIPLQRGIDTARRDDATIVWCHNEWGMEAVSNWLNGRVDAQNIFDGGIRSSFKDSFYRYLNVGMKVPFSTGTDWFMYDFSRVYVRMDDELTPKNWLAALAKGKSYITNGPLLEFKVVDISDSETTRAEIGETTDFNKPDRIRVIGKAVGRVDFKRIELILNGKVLLTKDTKPVGNHFEAKLETNIVSGGSFWIALRTPPPSVSNDKDLQRKTPLNELGRELFAHTSPIYVNVDGKSVFDRKLAQELLAEIQANRKMISERGKFEDEQAMARVLDVYDAGIASLQKRIKDR